MNAVEKLSRITGIEVDEIILIAKEAKENHKTLERCKGHNFCVEKTKGYWQCLHCGGYVSLLCKKWYEKGIQHGINKESD